jgi:hypothetical protein
MAFATVVFKNKRAKFLPQSQAEALWWIHEGGKKPRNKKQAQFAAAVERVYLNRKTAPAEYLAKHPIALDPKPDAEPWYKRYDNM